MRPFISQEIIDRVMRRLDLAGPEGEEEAARILREWDYNGGDVDDLLDRYEDEEAY